MTNSRPLSQRTSSQASVAEMAVPAATDKEAILKARAAALAVEAPTAAPPESLIEVIEFVLSQETYAIEASYIREVYPLRDLTTLPGVPAFVLGVINMRGEIISVIDLRTFFELPRQGITDLNKAIIVRNAAMEFGILADAVTKSRFISISDIQPAPATVGGIREQYLRGITAGPTIILDAGKLLTDPRLVVREDIES